MVNAAGSPSVTVDGGVIVIVGAALTFTVTVPERWPELDPLPLPDPLPDELCAPTVAVTVACCVVVSVVDARPLPSVDTSPDPRLPALVVNATGVPISGLPLTSRM